MTSDLEEWVAGPCVSCGESSSLSAREHVAMPVTKPRYVDPYLENLTGPNETHGLDGHCLNPKCNAVFDDSMIDPDGWVSCPQCGYEQNLGQTKDSPGGMTRAGLTLEQMGTIGEHVVFRMGELPGIGAVVPANDTPTSANPRDGGQFVDEPIDAIVQGQRGKFGCEIKTNHSQAQERFKIGGREERVKKIKFCMERGLKPALIGVRLNFYTDKAYIFFREGLTDTWIGNDRMIHVATVDFADLNPFKSPDAQAQALAVENANLPDQSVEDEFGGAFGLVAKTADFDSEHPRNDKGEFVAKKDEHHVKIVDKKGKHTHTAIGCKHCGSTLYVPNDHKRRLECSTCGKDPERDLKLAKVVLADPRYADEVARNMGWNLKGRNQSGERVYDYSDENGNYHLAQCGSGAHGKHAGQIDAQMLRQRMNRCMNGQCLHGPQNAVLAPITEPGAPRIQAGQIIDGNIVLEIDGGLALVQNLQTGEENVHPVSDLRATGRSKDAWS